MELNLPPHSYLGLVHLLTIREREMDDCQEDQTGKKGKQKAGRGSLMYGAEVGVHGEGPGHRSRVVEQKQKRKQEHSKNKGLALEKSLE